jgi:hypothetical protein
MYRPFLSILVVLALATMLSAQTPSGTASTAQDKSTTLTGCLSGPNAEGAYVLKSDRGTVEVGGSDDLKAHVGHEVKLAGTWAQSGTAIGEREENEAAEQNKKATTTESAEHHEKGSARERHFKVDNVTMVSETCTGKK